LETALHDCFKENTTSIETRSIPSTLYNAKIAETIFGPYVTLLKGTTTRQETATVVYHMNFLKIIKMLYFALMV
jgi:hypothetical protein